jgi:isopenicillin N synthase-like dioxygenase
LTFVLQYAEEGLEIKAQDGTWIKATPIQNSFVVNIGELLELATNGYLRATVHRVVAPPPGAERLANPIFQAFRKQCALPAIHPLNKRFIRSLRKSRRNHTTRITSTRAFLDSQGQPKKGSRRAYVFRVASDSCRKRVVSNTYV